MINRRSLITGLISFVAAPAIVRVESLMKLPKPVKALTDEEIKNILDKLWANSQFGKFAGERIWITYDECIKKYPISDEEYYA